MAISLRKGRAFSLKKAAVDSGSHAPLRNIDVHLRWQEQISGDTDFDADASAFMLNEQDKVNTSDDFIFYNQLEHYSGAIIHLGDDRKGSKGEILKVDLNLVPENIQKIIFVVSIHEADANNQSFGMISDAYIRIINSGDGKEIIRYDLTEDAGNDTSMIFAELYLNNNEWLLKAIGEGHYGGLQSLCEQYDVPIF